MDEKLRQMYADILRAENSATPEFMQRRIREQGDYVEGPNKGAHPNAWQLPGPNVFGYEGTPRPLGNASAPIPGVLNDSTQNYKSENSKRGYSNFYGGQERVMPYQYPTRQWRM